MKVSILFFLFFVWCHAGNYNFRTPISKINWYLNSLAGYYYYLPTSEFVDLNGDGLVDYVYSVHNVANNIFGNEAWINNGCGFVNTDIWDGRYCSKVFDEQIDKWVNETIEPKYLDFVKLQFEKEHITMETIHLLEEKHLMEMKMPIGVRLHLLDKLKKLRK